MPWRSLISGACALRAKECRKISPRRRGCFARRTDQGHAGAQFNLAGLYYQGKGVPQDFAEEEKWLRKAARQGFAQAQSRLVEYDNAQSVSRLNFKRTKVLTVFALCLSIGMGLSATKSTVGIAVGIEAFLSLSILLFFDRVLILSSSPPKAAMAFFSVPFMTYLFGVVVAFQGKWPWAIYWIVAGILTVVNSGHVKEIGLMKTSRMYITIGLAMVIFGISGPFYLFDKAWKICKPWVIK